MTDQELVDATLRDKNNYLDIVNKYENKLSVYINRLGSFDRDQVKDILQEVFIKAYLNINDYDSSLSFSSWIYRITHNETISFFRKQSIRPKTFSKQEDLQVFENLVSDIDLEKELDKRYVREQIQKSLAVLDYKYREVLVLRFLEEKSYEEISDILKIPSGTVATCINRGKVKLKEILKTNHI